MILKYKRIILVSLCLSMFSLVGCSLNTASPKNITQAANKTDSVKVDKLPENKDLLINIYNGSLDYTTHYEIYADTETGVEYILTHLTNGGVVFTPRLDAYGHPVLYEKFIKKQ